MSAVFIILLSIFALTRLSALTLPLTLSHSALIRAHSHVYPLSLPRTPAPIRAYSLSVPHTPARADARILTGEWWKP